MAAKKKTNIARKRTSKSRPANPIEKTLEQEVSELRADVAHWQRIANAAIDKGHRTRASNGSGSRPTSKRTLERRVQELRAELAIIKRIAQAVIAGELE